MKFKDWITKRPTCILRMDDYNERGVWCKYYESYVPFEYCNKKCSESHDPIKIALKKLKIQKQKIPYIRKIKPEKILPDIVYQKTIGENCCSIFKSHAEILKDDPERLSTDFIKKLSQCRCDEV